MEVILLKHQDNLGRRGDVVRVAPGYARNYLLPRRIAIAATPGARRLVAQEARHFEALDAKARGDAAALADHLAGLELQIPVKADEEGKLYGSVNVADIHRALAEKGIELERKQILLEQPIKLLGSYDVPLRLHLDVQGSVKVHVVQE